MTATKQELAALSTVKEFNALAKRAASTATETLALIWKAGERAKLAKDNTPHGEWMAFVDRHYDVSYKTVTRWVKFHTDIPEAKLDTVSNLTAALKMIESPKPKPNTSRKGAAPAGVTEVQEPAFPSAGASGHRAETHHPTSESCVEDPSADLGEDASTDATGTKPETSSRRPEKGKPAADVSREELLAEYKELIKPVTAMVRKAAKFLGEVDCHWHEEVTRFLVMASEDMKAWMNNWPPPKPDDHDTVVPPERQWVEEYIEIMNYGFSVDELFDYYEPRGWKPAKSTTKAKKWKPLCSTFERNRKRWASEAEKNGKVSGRFRSGKTKKRVSSE